MQSVLVGGWDCGVNCFVVNVSIFKRYLTCLVIVFVCVDRMT